MWKDSINLCQRVPQVKKLTLKWELKTVIELSVKRGKLDKSLVTKNMQGKKIENFQNHR